MYTREEREGILWEFHRSGLGVRRACRELPLFPNEENLYRRLRMERDEVYRFFGPHWQRNEFRSSEIAGVLPGDRV